MTAYPNIRGEEADVSGGSNKARAPQARRLVALTHDSALIKALQELTSGDLKISVVADMRGLSDELLQHTSGIALIDAAAVDAPVDGVVDAITTQFPDLRLMIAGQSAEQNVLATRISSQVVFRFVHKPASPQRLKLFMDAAARPGEQRGASAAADPYLDAAQPLANIESAMRGKSPVTLAIIGGVVLVAIVVGAWMFWPKEDPATAKLIAVPPVTGSTKSSPEVAALISKADVAFGAAKYIASDGSSAAELYRNALKLDAKNTIARSGYDRSIEFGLRAAEEALLGGKVDEAAAYAETLRLISPNNNSRLAFLNTQIAKEQARMSADASQRQNLEAKQTQIRASLAQMTDRIRHGALIEPAAGSAVAQFREAEAEGPGDPAVRNARETLVAALLTAADGELTARHAPAARRLVDAAGSINSSAPGLDVLRRRVDEVTTQLTAASNEAAAQAAKAAEAAAAAAAAAAPPKNAPSPSAAAADKTPVSVVSAATLKTIKTASPIYPDRALEQLISGWVEMEFTITKDGSVEDVVVTGSEPKRTFDSAASTAIRHYRYAPILRNGEPVTQRARLRMRFTAAEGGR